MSTGKLAGKSSASAVSRKAASLTLIKTWPLLDPLLWNVQREHALANDAYVDSEANVGCMQRPYACRAAIGPRTVKLHAYGQCHEIMQLYA